MYIQPKNKLWTVVICVIYILCFKSDMFLSDSSASLYLFYLFWRANQLNAKNRRRFTKVGHLRYFMGLSCKVECFHGRTLPVRPARSCPLWGKVGETPLQWRPLLFLLRQFWELTNLFWFNFFSSSYSFRSRSQLRTFIEVFNISVFSIW